MERHVDFLQEKGYDLTNDPEFRFTVEWMEIDAFEGMKDRMSYLTTASDEAQGEAEMFLRETAFWYDRVTDRFYCEISGRYGREVEPFRKKVGMVLDYDTPQ